MSSSVKLNTFIFSALLFLGMYLPTSYGAVMFSKTATQITLLLCFVAYAAILYKTKRIDKLLACLFLIINLAFWIFTMVTPFTKYTWGAAFLFFLLSLMFCLDLKNIKLSNKISSVFMCVNVINILASFLVLSQNVTVDQFIINNYSSFYPDLVTNMMAFKKPVLTFGTHSLAGFYLFLFFYMNFKTYIKKKKIIYFLIALLYLFIGFSLNSNTGYVYVLLGIMNVLWYLFRKKPIIFYFGVPILAFIMFVFSSYFNDSYQQVINKINSNNNGLAARYTAEGNLKYNIEFIKENPMQPIGAGYSDQITYVDSGIVEYTLRGTVLFVAILFVTLFLFFRRNIKSTSTAIYLFLAFVFFEIGFANLMYFRTFYLMPFLIVYLNFLEGQSTAVKESTNKSTTIMRQNKLSA